MKTTPPGPAFIPWPGKYPAPAWNAYLWQIGEMLGVPSWYVWQPATESTMAGWVRPRGKPE